MDPHFRKHVRELGERARDLRRDVEHAVREAPNTLSEVASHVKSEVETVPSVLGDLAQRVKVGVLADKEGLMDLAAMGGAVGGIILAREVMLAHSISPETERRIEQVKTEKQVKKEMERRGYEYTPPQ